MRKSIILAAMIAAGFIACKKTDTASYFKNKIIGDWLVTGTHSFNNEGGMTVEWGLYYVNEVGLKNNNSFTVNGSVTPTGTWELKDNQHRIIFYTQITDAGTVYRDTTAFNISLDATDHLILENDWAYFRHKRIR
jgi:hypothetical protein